MPENTDKPAYAYRQTNNDLLMSVSEAWNYLGISRALLYQLIGRGEVLRVRLGGLAFVTRESVDAYIERQIEAAKAAS